MAVYDTFLSGRYVADSQTRGGCRLFNVRERNEDQTLSLKPVNNVSIGQRYDQLFVLTGDPKTLQADWDVFKETTDVNTPYRQFVFQNPNLDIPPFETMRRPSTTAGATTAGGRVVKINRGSSATHMIPKGTLIGFTNPSGVLITERFHRVTADVEVIAADRNLNIFPKLDTPIPSDSLIDLYPQPLWYLSSEGGFSISTYEALGALDIAYRARNAVK